MSDINETRAHDIYTVTPPTSGSIYTDDFISLSGRVSPLESSATDCDPHVRSKYQMKKYFGKKLYYVLPVVAEEDGKLSKSPESPFSSGMSEHRYVSSKKESLTKDVESDDDVESSDEDDDNDIFVYDDHYSACTDESWVDLSKQSSQTSGTSSPFTQVAMSYGSSTPERVTPPPFGNGEEYLRLLREAQKESNQPKSPPNSPNTEAVLDNEEPSLLKGVYINYYNREGDFVRVEKNVETDWIWDWSSRPDQTPPKQWKFVHPHKGTVPSRRGASIRRLMVGNSSLFSRDVLYTLFITNVLSLILGTGIGMWLSRKSGGGGNGSNVPLAIVPIN
ncbi:NIP3-like protein [Armadillidium vulgare]|nr:NIP3-like protein [Armadillidium vulgare]